MGIFCHHLHRCSVVVRLVKQLAARPVPSAERATVRTYNRESDIERWLEIRRQSLAGQIAAGRLWTREDFHREFSGKPSWRPERMWFAEVDDAAGPKSVGAVAMAFPEGRENLAAIQWLLVLPDYRRRGIGRLLIATLESAAWDDGCRTVMAETLSTWDAAMRFYKSLGYEEAHR